MNRRQYVVAFDKRGKKGAVFATAYDDSQIDRAVQVCTREHGSRSNVRSGLAAEHRRKYG